MIFLFRITILLLFIIKFQGFGLKEYIARLITNTIGGIWFQITLAIPHGKG
jgi:hypothetical protein